MFSAHLTRLNGGDLHMELFLAQETPAPRLD